MEFLLNLMWLVVSVALGGLFLTTRSRWEVASQKCIHSRTTAWISYAVLIAMLLPVISMTDDLMAMVAPTDGEQITRRYDASPAAPNRATVQVAALPIMRDGFPAPLIFVGNLEPIPGFDGFRLPPPRHTQGRAPPVTA